MDLKKKTILITRRAEQAGDMIDEVQRLGGVALLAPMIEIADPESWEAADGAVRTLDRFDALVVASANAAERFLGRCGGKIRELRRFAVYAVGEKTRETVERFGLNTRSLPEHFSAAGLAAAVDPDAIRGQRVLIPCGDRSRQELPRLLEEMGAEVVTVVVYRTVRPEETDGALLNDHIRNRRIDVVSFASPSAVINLVDLLTEEDLASLRAHSIVAAIGPTTAESAKQAGFSVAIVAKESTGPGLVRAIAEYYQ